MYKMLNKSDKDLLCINGGIVSLQEKGLEEFCKWPQVKPMKLFYQIVGFCGDVPEVFTALGSRL